MLSERFILSKLDKLAKSKHLLINMYDFILYFLYSVQPNKDRSGQYNVSILLTLIFMSHVFAIFSITELIIGEPISLPFQINGETYGKRKVQWMIIVAPIIIFLSYLFKLRFKIAERKFAHIDMKTPKNLILGFGLIILPSIWALYYAINWRLFY